MPITVNDFITIALAVITVLNFAISRKDKAVNDTKESNLGLINYRLNELDKNVQKILAKLETYDNEIDTRIEKALNIHIKEFHK